MMSDVEIADKARSLQKEADRLVNILKDRGYSMAKNDQLGELYFYRMTKVTI